MNKPTLHIISPWHVVLDPNRESCCAFGMKAFKLSAMMQPMGYECVEYSNEGSKSEAATKVRMLSELEHERCFPRLPPTGFQGSYATIGNEGWQLFDKRMREAMQNRIKDGDVICHVFGQAHTGLVRDFPQAIHVETGIGYPDEPFGAWRIFESATWRAYHWGRDDQKQHLRGNNGLNRYYSYIIPNSFDEREWDVGNGKDDYVVFMSRIDPCKGLAVIVEIIKANAIQARVGMAKLLHWVFAGQGDFKKHILDNVLGGQSGLSESDVHITHLGPVQGRARSEVLGRARCMILPTEYVEPFGGAIIEGQLCGTPSITVDYGCFTETVDHGVTGYRCHTLGDYLAAIEASKKLNRDYIAKNARAKWGLTPVAALYDQAFMELSELHRGPGWYSATSWRVQPPAS